MRSAGLRLLADIGGEYSDPDLLGDDVKPPANDGQTAELSKLYAELDKRKKTRLLEFYRPYAKTAEFHRLGASKHEVALIAANRSGKTWAAAAEVAMHMTGLYPDWWEGRRFTKAIRAWVCGVTGLAVRDTPQKYLCGPPQVEAEQGTGFIPKNLLGKCSTAHGYSGLYDTIQAKHISGGTSTCTLKSYEMGRAKFQADTCDLIWLDEESPMDIYSECYTRLATTGGLLLCTFTPLLGMSEVVMRYLNEPNSDRAWVSLSLSEAGHITPDERERIIAGWPAHEREARSKGVPMLGSGRIFQVSEESISMPRPASLPKYWAYGIGGDFGIDHPFAAVECAWDRDSDVFMVLDGFKMKDARPIDHAARMKAWGRLRFFWPHDGSVRDKGSGETLASQYKVHAVNTWPKHAHHPDGSISTEACIQQMNEAMSTGKFKVAQSFDAWLQEFRLYHRKDGQIVKVNDDLLSATMKAWMMKRHFSQDEPGAWGAKRKEVRIAEGTDYDVFA